MTERGVYTVIEGSDGVGKSSVVQYLAKRNRVERGVRTFTVEEPDSIRDEHGTTLVPIAEILRTTIKAKEFGRSALTNVLLFNASRRENLLQGIEPALAAGIDVFGARNFESTTVYQGFAEGWDIEEIWRMVLEATSEAYMHPDHTFVLDLPEEERCLRLAIRDSKTHLDTFESRPTDFQVKVNDGYRTLADLRGYPIISASPNIEIVGHEIWQYIHGQNAA
ncbi:MAG: dTMP kinase [Candidatus Microsaccharimonas sossegonensis]|uniref:Thymidylate kinase n=1 Tax=Candidatus Microsaccharimonas sossegonensis TaxID=2506948 RepID=A0A4V1J7H5_9BACT|nr:MAG: dTMP kinase [Candidatus Microsaccharimonas sossegonensis]